MADLGLVVADLVVGLMLGCVFAVIAPSWLNAVLPRIAMIIMTVSNSIIV